MKLNEILAIVEEMNRSRIDSFDDWKYQCLQKNDQAILSTTVVPKSDDRQLHTVKKAPKKDCFAMWPGSSRVIGKWYADKGYGELHGTKE
jgi:hypothetical protein